MKKWILCILLSTCAFNSAHAKDCTLYEEKIRKLEDLRRQGGSLKQMERWRIQADDLTSKRRSCNNEGSSIQIATGNAASKTKATKINTNASKTEKSQKLRKTSNKDPQVQKLLGTCNYWITEQNNKPTFDNKTFRDTACRALDEKLSAETAPPPANLSNLRSLKECIKPNNLIDSDVQECRQGLRDPTWKR